MTDAEFAKAIKGLTPEQKDALVQMTLDNGDGFHPATYKAFESRGLIESFAQVLPGRLPITVRRYRMPIHVHIAATSWVAALPDAQEP